MMINARMLAAFVALSLFGGIALSSALGWWNTESTKQPARFTEGEFAGAYNPADIRGSYTFGDIESAFGVPAQTLAQAFGVSTDDPAAFAVKDLETLYAESPQEVGTASVRLFVALYTGLPYDLTVAEETYLLQKAVNILRNHATLTPEQEAFLAAHAVSVESVPAPAAEAQPTPVPASEENPYLIKGKTTFGDLLEWGVSKEVIEQVLGASMPNAAVKIKDYCTQNGLAFETIKTALQAEVDKLKP
ncbi:MAG: hypothetical protein WHV44_14000 [Anaerolineales bacterium]